MESIGLALALDPLSTPIRLDAADIYRYQGMPRLARQMAQEADKAGDPRATLALLGIALATGDFREAARLEKAQALLTCAFLPSSRAEVAEFGRRMASQECEARYPLLDRAAWGAWAGQREQALTLLERARDEHHFFTIYAGVDPRFASLKGDPRYEAVLRAVGLGR